MPDLIPIVNGDIEIIEVKTGKANIPPYQQKNYRQVVKNGFTFRYFHVDIVTLNENHFEVEEKLLTNPEEVKSFPL